MEMGRRRRWRFGDVWRERKVGGFGGGMKVGERMEMEIVVVADGSRMRGADLQATRCFSFPPMFSAGSQRVFGKKTN